MFVYLESGESAAEDSGGESDGGDAGGVAPVAGVWLPIIGADVGRVLWPFTSVPGPRYDAPPADARPIEYVDLFFSPQFLNAIVADTNRYADQLSPQVDQAGSDKP